LKLANAHSQQEQPARTPIADYSKCKLFLHVSLLPSYMVLLSSKEADFQLAIANRVTWVSFRPLTNLSDLSLLKD
jgi:hypothetical protein